MRNRLSYLALISVLAATLVCGGCLFPKRYDPHRKEIERIENETYVKGSNDCKHKAIKGRNLLRLNKELARVVTSGDVQLGFGSLNTGAHAYLILSKNGKLYLCDPTWHDYDGLPLNEGYSMEGRDKPSLVYSDNATPKDLVFGREIIGINWEILPSKTRDYLIEKGYVPSKKPFRLEDYFKPELFQKEERELTEKVFGKKFSDEYYKKNPQRKY